ncbi:MAG: reverse transcriptase-like protein, partial [Cyanobacteria bacterium P01_G01_bin.49]
KLGLKALQIKGDSDLVFNQINGLTPVKEERLIEAYRTALKLMQGFEKVSLEWISPEQNRPTKYVVKRCIEKALEQESKESISRRFLSAIAHLIQQGEQATERDYRKLRVSADEWTEKPLSELRALISLEVRDEIALEWQGNEENLAQMYRWYLRGLPPKMACRKVNLEQATKMPNKGKLPWEEALLSLPPQPVYQDNDSDALISLLSELDQGVETGGELSVNPPREPNLFETFEISDPQNSQQNSIPSTSTINFNDSNTPEQVDEPGSLFGEKNRKPTINVGQDTLPSESSVAEILKMVDNFSAQEKIAFAQGLVKSPEMVNLILKAIADNVSQDNATQ